MFQVHDDWLPIDEFNELSDFILGWNFPWFHQRNVALPDTNEEDVTYNSYFTHNLILTDIGNDMVSYLHEPIWKYFQERFPDIYIIRMKVNCFPATSQVYEHLTHTDYDYPHKGALLCLNTCNGYTKMEDGTKIESVANRMIFFDTSKPHNSTTCSDQPKRCNIVINYNEI
tara:strand:- start:148 stop:660 length:513 start_codon:yes stop_codon:yes gene_type:complete